MTPAMLVPVVLAALAAPAPALASPDYCRLSAKHTLCRYRGVAPECSHHSERRASPSPGLHHISRNLVELETKVAEDYAKRLLALSHLTHSRP